jgi:hypothetical protein
MALSLEEKKLYKSSLDAMVLMDDLHELLKKHKDTNKEIIRLSGTKSDLIDNILEAVDQSIIDIFEVQALIKDSEEFGDQHIFIFSINDDNFKSKYNDGESLAQQIIPNDKRSMFPRLIDQPQQLEWADFRTLNRGVLNSWLMKLYDVKFREIKENENIDITNHTRTVIYKREESKLIYIIEWNGVDEIEIKISRTSFDSLKSIKKSIGLIKNIVHSSGNGVVLDLHFSKTNLTSCINKIITDSANNEDIYKLVSTVFVDSQGGMATIKSVDDQGHQDLLSEDSRKEAITAYLNGDAIGTGLVIRFLASGSKGILKNDINVIIGKDDENHLIIPAKIKSQEYKYVRRKIAEFS